MVFIYSSANLSLAKSSNTILSSSSSPKLFWYFILSELLVFFNTPFCGCLGAVQSSDAEVQNYFFCLINSYKKKCLTSYLLGFGCISLNGTSVTSSPPRVPQFNFTLTEYEMTIPVWSLGPLPSDINVDDAKLTSSSCSIYCMHFIQYTPTCWK